jgi:hypothetical protein
MFKHANSKQEEQVHLRAMSTERKHRQCLRLVLQGPLSVTLPPPTLAPFSVFPVSFFAVPLDINFAAAFGFPPENGLMMPEPFWVSTAGNLYIRKPFTSAYTWLDRHVSARLLVLALQPDKA